MIKENTLFEKTDKVEIAIDRIKTFEPKDKGYYLAFSGGKDSIVIHRLAVMAKVKFDAVYNVTTIDPPELIYFIRKEYKKVKFDYPDLPFLKRLETKGFPIRQQRWCCAEYKERGGTGRLVMMGIRKKESNQRSKRRLVEFCYKDSTKRMLNPIIDWTDAEVWEFIKSERLKYCSLYDLGFKRLGCLFCPMNTDRKKHAERYPRFKRNFIKSFEKLYENKKDKWQNVKARWKNGEEMFNWWLDEIKTKEDKQQLKLF